MEEEADRTGVGPLHIIQEQEQRVIACQELQNTRDLFKEIGLLKGRLPVSDFATRWLLQTVEPNPPRVIRRFARKGLGAQGQSCSRHEGVNQVRPRLCQRRDRIRQNSPQAAGMFGRQGCPRPFRFDVTAEQLQDLAEGQIGVTDAGGGVAVAAGHHQVGVGLHRLPGKFTEQSGFAAPGFAGDEDHLTCAGK